MNTIFPKKHSLFLKLVLVVGTILFISMGSSSLFSISYVKKNILNNVIADADIFASTIKLTTQHSMMTDTWDEITQSIDYIVRQGNVENIRIFHKEGEIVYSNKDEELGEIMDIKDYACTICHKYNNPPTTIGLKNRTRFITSPEGKKFLGIVDPIYNEPGCSSASCHANSRDSNILGTLDVVISLDHIDKEISFLEKVYSALAILSFLITSILIFLYLNRFVSRPIRKMISGTEMIANGEHFDANTIKRNDELGHLASAISSMGNEVSNQKDELIKTNDELLKANGQLEILSFTDPLTGLANRRYLLENFTTEYERANRYKHHLSILIIDVDHFKNVNDIYGHSCGDAVLKGTADIMREIIRSTDLIARFGGDEIVVLLPEADNKQALIIAEKLRHAIASNTVLCEDTSLAITVSIGVATHPEIDSSEPMQLFNAADQALYNAKENGRNKAVSYGADFI